MIVPAMKFFLIQIDKCVLDVFNELPTGVFQVIFVWGKMLIPGTIIAR